MSSINQNKNEDNIKFKFTDYSIIYRFLWKYCPNFSILTAYFKDLDILSIIRFLKMAALRNNFERESGGTPLSRRGFLRGFGAAAGVGAFGLASFPANDAEAGERPSHMMRDMRHYSEDPSERGIGAFINLRANSSVTGDQIGEWIQAQFAGIEDPVQVDYRVNQSRGTATDITFYVRGVDYTLNVAELQTHLIEILKSHRGAWLPEATAALNQPAATQQ